MGTRSHDRNGQGTPGRRLLTRLAAPMWALKGQAAPPASSFSSFPRGHVKWPCRVAM